MPVPLAAAAAAAPLADQGVKLASSVVAHISAALGTPLLKTEEIRTRTTRRGTITRTTSAALPAWAAIAGGLILLAASGWQPGTVLGGPRVLPWWADPLGIIVPWR